MEKFEPTDEEIAEYAVLIRYYDTQDWLKHEINAGRYRDPKPELNEMIPDLSLGETLDPSEARPCLDEKPGPPLELGPGQVHLSEMELRECVRVAQARYDYKCAHQEEMDRWLEERARKPKPESQYVKVPGDSLRLLEQGIRDNETEISQLYQHYEPTDIETYPDEP
jgi:hypothetical protein